MIYFNNIQSEIITRIRDAKTSLKIAVAWFNNQSLFDVVMEKLDSGCKVSLIVINDRVNNSGVDFQKFIDRDGLLYFSNEAPGKLGVVHHKFCVIDESLVISGSYNWTNKAEHYNKENITIFSEKRIVKEFSEEFEKIIALHKPPIKDISASKKMEYYFEEILSLWPTSLEIPISENIIQKHSISSDEIIISIIDRLDLSECRSSWNEFHKNRCEIIINPWENAPAIISAGADIPEGGLTNTATFHTLVDNVLQVSIYVIKNSSTRRRIAIFRNLASKPIRANILEIKLHLNKTGDLKVECKEIGGEKILVETIREIFSSSQLKFKQT